MYVAFTPDEVERIARELEGLAWVRKLPPTNPHERLRAEAEGVRFVVWGSGKLGYQGPHARAALEEVVRAAGVEEAAQANTTGVGSDEAGKGEWLGPMVVAAVAVRPGQRMALRLDGVRDSKQLKGEVRQRMAQSVKARAAAWEVVSIGPRRFNELWDAMHARGENLNDLLWWAHRKALEPVLGAVAGDTHVEVVVDEFDKTRRATRVLGATVPQGAEVVQVPRAEDRSIAVAAASVLARAERDAAVEALVARFGLDGDRLTPEAAAEHPQAAEFAKVAYLRNAGSPGAAGSR